ncbi:MAG: hypothetical protein IIV47_04985, partial [Clostridia bacterium]|nr:hypothetical protein [Clostridia bacterium]
NGIEIMYSPRPTVFTVTQGSVSEEINEEAVPEISIYEQYCKMIAQDTKKIFDSIVERINDTNTDSDIPTAKAVVDYVNEVIGGIENGSY